MIAVVACHCGSSDSLVRNFLSSVGYADWATIPITKGREASLSFTNQLPPSDGKDMLKSLLANASKWAIIIGWEGNVVKWSDIAHNWSKSSIDARLIVENFSNLR
jgi:hypothetical protein